MEERLKKFKIKTISRMIAVSVFGFILIYPLSFGIISREQWFKYGIIIVAVLLVLGYIFRKRARKNREELLSVMPMIISTKDTVQSLKKERTVYNTIYVLMFAFGMTGAQYGPFKLLFCIVFALSCVFMDFASLTTEKIKYLENKPEGL